MKDQRVATSRSLPCNIESRVVALDWCTSMDKGILPAAYNGHITCDQRKIKTIHKSWDFGVQHAMQKDEEDMFKLNLMHLSAY